MYTYSYVYLTSLLNVTCYYYNIRHALTIATPRSTVWPTAVLQLQSVQNFISFHLFADNIAIYKADTVILGCRSPQGNNLLRGAYRKKIK